MTSFVPLPSRTEGQRAKVQTWKPAIIVTVLGLLLLFQVGLVLWVFVKQW